MKKVVLAILTFVIGAFGQSRDYVRVYKSGADAIDVDKSSIRRCGDVANFKVRMIQGRTWMIRKVDIDCITRMTRVWTDDGRPGYWRATFAPGQLVAVVCH